MGEHTGRMVSEDMARRAEASSANDRQVGGDHYGGKEYQHWDFVTDAGLAYLPGVGTKYMDRWPRKAGRQDVEKALHYAQKCLERDVPPPQQSAAQREIVAKFCRQVADIDSRLAIYAFAEGRYADAIGYIQEVLRRLQAAEASIAARQGT